MKEKRSRTQAVTHPSQPMQPALILFPPQNHPRRSAVNTPAIPLQGPQYQAVTTPDACHLGPWYSLVHTPLPPECDDAYLYGML